MIWTTESIMDNSMYQLQQQGNRSNLFHQLALKNAAKLSKSHILEQSRDNQFLGRMLSNIGEPKNKLLWVVTVPWQNQLCHWQQNFTTCGLLAGIFIAYFGWSSSNDPMLYFFWKEPMVWEEETYCQHSSGITELIKQHKHYCRK